MALVPAKPPARAEAILTESLSALPRIGALEAPQASEVSAGQPLRVFLLGPEALVSGKGLEDAVFVGWQYFLFDRDQSLGVAQIDDQGDEKLSFSHFNQGQLADNELATLRRIESAIPPGRDYEPRLLDMPAIYFLGLWLAGADPLIAPIGRPVGPLEPGRPYPAAEVLALLRPAAEAALAQDLYP